LPCLTNIASALSPDYTLSSDSADYEDRWAHWFEFRILTLML
jgi:hypothetical protein